MGIALESGPAVDNAEPTTAAGLIAAQQRLRQMVLDTLPSHHSRRNYAKALDNLFAFAAGRPLMRALVMEYRASRSACRLDHQCPAVRDPQAGRRGAQEWDVIC